jgi:hypothetical protein
LTDSASAWRPLQRMSKSRGRAVLDQRSGPDGGVVESRVCLAVGARDRADKPRSRNTWSGHPAAHATTRPPLRPCGARRARLPPAGQARRRPTAIRLAVAAPGRAARRQQDVRKRTPPRMVCLADQIQPGILPLIEPQFMLACGRDRGFGWGEPLRRHPSLGHRRPEALAACNGVIVVTPRRGFELLQLDRWPPIGLAFCER